MAMHTKIRMNVYFDPDLLKRVEALALRRNVSKSAFIEATVASFLSADASERLETVFARRLDRIGRQIDGLDEDLAIVGETLSLFIRFWLTITPPLPDSAQASTRTDKRSRGLPRLAEPVATPKTGKSGVPRQLGECLVTDLFGSAFPGYYLCYPSRRQMSPAFALLVEALRHRG